MSEESSAVKTNMGLMRIVRAAGFSIKGLWHCLRYEAAFRQEVILSLLLIPLAIIYAENAIEMAMLLASWLFVLIVELLNTAIEAVVDRVGAEIHPLSGQAKDVASAAVFLSIAQAVVVWSILLIPWASF